MRPILAEGLVCQGRTVGFELTLVSRRLMTDGAAVCAFSQTRRPAWQPALPQQAREDPVITAVSGELAVRLATP
jgi:hypothetical protein